MWVLGGQKQSGAYSKKIYSSTDGVNWKEEGSDSAPIIYLVGHTSLVFDNKMWIIGNNPKNVFYSSDGINWTEAGTDSFPINLNRASSVVHNNKMWVIGGVAKQGGSRKVFYSTNGINWTEAGNDSLPVGLYRFGLLSYNNKLWVIGGNYIEGDYQRTFTTLVSKKVYSSTDGINWTEVGNDAFPKGIFSHSSVVFDNKMWVINGYDGINKGRGGGAREVYYSTDGANWKQVGVGSFPDLQGENALIFNNKIWLIGGYTTTDKSRPSFYNEFSECSSVVPSSSSSSGSACPVIDCSSPPAGCMYDAGITLTNGCLNCGNLICSSSSSSSGSIFNNSSSSSSSSGGINESPKLNLNFKGVWRGTVKQSLTQKKKIITLRLCVNNGELQGTVKVPGVFDLSDIVSQEVQSENEVSIDVADENDNIITLILKLLNNKSMQIKLEDGSEGKIRKTGTNRSCLL